MANKYLTRGLKFKKVIKRLIDMVMSVIGLIVLSPIFLIIMFLIKLDGGPIFFGHERIGFNNSKFTCWKFRTMFPNSEKILENHFKKNQKLKNEWEKNFKLVNDPRITKIGKFLRRTSLDELPQLFNVLIGQMSIVGPRPIVKEEKKYYKNKLDYYLSTKPGLTGLWQVSGRSNTTYKKRINLDVEYMRSWSLTSDFIIVLKTIKAVLLGRGAL